MLLFHLHSAFSVHCSLLTLGISLVILSPILLAQRGSEPRLSLQAYTDLFLFVCVPSVLSMKATWFKIGCCPCSPVSLNTLQWARRFCRKANPNGQKFHYMVQCQAHSRSVWLAHGLWLSQFSPRKVCFLPVSPHFFSCVGGNLFLSNFTFIRSHSRI